ncbi:MAG: hypothetical protein KBD31_04935 [Proteobacteria bacterium]|nr:hypothetical protein [Pseudomonadota bacterium]
MKFTIFIFSAISVFCYASDDVGSYTQQHGFVFLDGQTLPPPQDEDALSVVENSSTSSENGQQPPNNSFQEEGEGQTTISEEALVIEQKIFPQQTNRISDVGLRCRKPQIAREFSAFASSDEDSDPTKESPVKATSQSKHNQDSQYKRSLLDFDFNRIHTKAILASITFACSLFTMLFIIDNFYIHPHSK